MKNAILRILFGVIVFLVTVFGLELAGTQSGTDTTQEMAMASLPVLAMDVAGRECNEMHGYRTERDLTQIRPAITPVGTDRLVVLHVRSYQSVITGMTFEVRDPEDGRLVEATAVPVPTAGSMQAAAGNASYDLSFTIKDLIEEEKEYFLVILCDLADGRTIRYYSRILETEEDYDEALSFAERFHSGTFAADEELKTYLESDESGDNSTFARVTIHSSFEQVTWGGLKVESTPCHLQMTQIAGNELELNLDYMVERETDAEENNKSSVLYYHCREFYRLREGTERYYLIDYERGMDQILDPTGDHYGDDLISLGIIDPDFPYLKSSGSAFAFVNEGRLFVCSPSDQTVAYVFGFADPEDTDERDLFGEHEIRILRVDEAGNTEFAVCGYMNRGAHEGEAGTALYSYNSVYRTIEERAFIPYAGSYEVLALYLQRLCYLNGRGQYHFLQSDTLYTLRVDQRTVSVTEEGLSSGHFCTSQDGRMAAWNTEDSNQEEVTVLDLATMARRTVSAGAGERVIPIGFLQNDLVYGRVRQEDVETDLLGTEFLPVTAIEIVSGSLEEQGHYEAPGYCITAWEVGENQITLHRALRVVSEDGSVQYQQAEDDQIVATLAGEGTPSRVRTLAVDLLETIVEIDAIGLDADRIHYVRPREMMTEGSRTASVPVTGRRDPGGQYIVYGLTGAQLLTEDAASAVRYAGEVSGSVIGEGGELVYRTGSMLPRNQLMVMSKSEDVIQAMGQDAVDACIDRILEFEGRDRSMTAPDVPAGQAAVHGAAGDLRHFLPDARIYLLTGCSLKEVLYYVSIEKPVLALRGAQDPVLIIGYNDEIIVLSDPATGTVHSVPRKELERQLEQSGNRFLAYSTT